MLSVTAAQDLGVYDQWQELRLQPRRCAVSKDGLLLTHHWGGTCAGMQNATGSHYAVKADAEGANRL